MAGNIKGITVEIGGNTTKLQQALQDVNKKSTSLQKELNSVNKLLKLDPTNTQLLTQKQQILAQAIENTRKKLDTLTQAQEQAKKQLENGEISVEQYRELERQVEATKQKLAGYENQMKEVGDATEKAGKKSTEFRDKALTVASVVTVIQTVVRVVQQVTQAFQEAAVAAAAYADEVNTLAAKYQISTASLQKFQYAAEIVDVDLETFGSSLGRLSKNMGKAEKDTSEQAKAFKKLGVSIYDADGKLRDSEDVFYEVIDALGAMDNETEANVAANALFGRSFQELNPLVSAGTAKLKELGAEAEAVGYVIDQDTLDATNAFQDSLDRLNNLTDLATRKFSTGMTPSLNKVAEALNKSLASPTLQRQLVKVGEAFGKIAEFFGQLAVSILSNLPSMIILLGGLAAAIVAINFSKFLDGISKIGKALSGNIVTLCIMAAAAIASLVAALVSAEQEFQDLKADSENLKDSLDELIESFDLQEESLGATSEVANDLVDDIDKLNKEVEDLNKNGQDSSTQQALLAQKVDALNTVMGETVATINSENGMLNENTSTIRQNIKAIQDRAKAAAYEEYLAELYKKRIELESQEKIALEKLDEAQGKYDKRLNEETFYATVKDVSNKKAATEAVDTLTGAISDNETEIKNIEEEYKNYIDVTGETATAVEELSEAEQENATKRLSIVTNCNDAINLDDQISLEERLEIIKENQRKIVDYEQGMTSLREQAIKDGNNNMLRYLDTLGDYEEDSMAIISQMVTDFAEGGGEMAKQLADEYVKGLDSKAGQVAGASYELGSESQTAAGEGVSDNQAMLDEAETQVANTVEGMRQQILDNNSFYFLGIGIINRLAQGISDMAWKVYDVVDEVVNNIKNKFGFNVSVDGKTTSVRGFATGGVVWNREIVQVAENGPEAIIPLNKLGNIINGLLSGGASYGSSSSINVTVPIQVSQSLSESDIKAKSKLIARTVSREFALGR